jgi:drug/metabolite transporter (DMT)-like permease
MLSDSSGKNTLQIVGAHAAVLLAGWMWGSVGIFVRPLDERGYTPLTIVFVRMAVAFAILFVCLFVFNRKLLRIKLKDLWVFICTALTSAIVLNVFYSMSILMNSLALAAVLLSTDPFFVVFLSAVFFKEKVTSMKVAALFLAFAGCVLISGLIGSASGFNAAAILIGVLAGFGYALYSIFSRVALNKGYDSFTINVYSFGIGALACLPFVNFSAIAGSVAAEPAYMSVLLLAHAAFTSLLPYILYTYGMKYMDTGKASIIESVEPASAAVYGALIFGEFLSAMDITGMVLVYLAIVLLNIKKPKRLLRGFAAGRKK